MRANARGCKTQSHQPLSSPLRRRGNLVYASKYILYNCSIVTTPAVSIDQFRVDTHLCKRRTTSVVRFQLSFTIVYTYGLRKVMDFFIGLSFRFSKKKNTQRVWVRCGVVLSSHYVPSEGNNNVSPLPYASSSTRCTITTISVLLVACVGGGMKATR